MEIISYVGQQQKRRTFSGGFGARKKQKSQSVFSDISSSQSLVGLDFDKRLVLHSYTPEVKEFSAQKIKTDFNFRLFIAAIGRGVEKFLKFIAKNISKILIILSSAVLLSGGIYFGVKVFQHVRNFTGPLALNTDDTLDLENLNSLMAQFALEGTEVDDSGNIIGTENFVSNYTQPVTYQNYKVQNGDTISGITKKFGLKNISTLISVNEIGNVRQLAAGQKLKIPSVDGITYTVKAGDTLEKITKNNNVKLSTLLDVNDLTSETLTAGQVLFLPGASLDSNTLKLAMGDKFIMPIKAAFRWTSPYGARLDPITGVKSYHRGTDMACPTGTPIYASMSGKVITAGTSRIYGYYVIIEHGNGYQTLYGHMSKIIVAKGQWVSQGTRIGLVGSTGYSTGPHLHFTVYKNGKTIDPMTILK